MLDVVIVGAGAAGIAAVRRLAELGLSALLVEAKTMVGGRASTDNDTFGVPFDLGCYWFHSPDHNPLIAHADALGIRYLANGQKTRYVHNGEWLNDAKASACEGYIEACFERIAAHVRHGQDRAASELFDGSDPWHSAFEAEFTAKQGVPPQQSSTYDFARYLWTGDDLPVIGGLGNLISRLAAHLPVSLNTPVSRIELLPRSVRVATARGASKRAPPLSRFRPACCEAEQFSLCRSCPIGNGPPSTPCPWGIATRSASPFYGLSWVIATTGLSCRCAQLSKRWSWCSSPEGTKWRSRSSMGRSGRSWAGAGAAIMVDYTVERLVETFGSAIRKAVSPVQVIADWDRDPFVLGYVSAALPGRADARLDLARPLGDRLFFAGEATSLQFMGDVHGAWLSGIDAANTAARALE
jgi:monoamine oxidase